MRIYLAMMLSFSSLVATAQLWETVTPQPNFVVGPLSVPDTTHWRTLSGQSVYYTNDAGISWNSISLGRNLYRVQFIDPQTGWVSSDSNRIYRTTDGCATWDTLIAPAPSWKFTFWDSLSGYLIHSAAQSDSLFKTNDGGYTWTGYDITVPQYPFFIDSLRGWAFGEFYTDTVYRTSDGGLSWHPVGMPSGISYYSKVKFIDSLNGWFSNSIDLMRTRDGGNSWQIISSMGFDDFSFRDTSHGILSSYSDLFFSSSDSTYSLVYNSSSNSFNAELSTVVIQGKYFIYGYGELASSNDGFNWIVHAYNTFPNYVDGYYFQPPQLSFSSQKNGAFLTGDLPTGMSFFTNMTYVTTDSGKTWQERSNVFPLCHDIQMLSDSLWYFIQWNFHDGSASLFKSYDQLNSSMTLGNSNNVNLKPRSFFFTDSMHGVWEDKYTVDGGITWQPSTINGGSYLGDKFYFTDQFNGWGIGNGTVYRTSDGGITWNAIGSLPYPDVPTKIQFTDSLTGFVSYLYSTAMTGFLFKTTDGGVSWSAMNVPTGYPDFHFIDSLRGWFSGAGILFTADGGLTFSMQSNEDIDFITFIDSIHGFACKQMRFYKTDQTGILNSVSQAIEHHSVSVYPNPATEYITITHNENIELVEFFDLMGRRIFHSFVPNSTMSRINLNGLNKGVYFLKIKTKDTVFKKTVSKL